jgi:hypothetical protein
VFAKNDLTRSQNRETFCSFSHFTKEEIMNPQARLTNKQLKVKVEGKHLFPSFSAFSKHSSVTSKAKEQDPSPSPMTTELSPYALGSPRLTHRLPTSLKSEPSEIADNNNGLKNKNECLGHLENWKQVNKFMAHSVKDDKNKGE